MVKKKEKVNGKEKILTNWFAYIKIIAYLFIFASSIAILTTVFLGAYSALEIEKSTRQEILSDSTVTTYLSRLNDYTNEDLNDMILNHPIKEILIFELILPTVSYLAIFILMVISCIYIIKLSNNVKTTNDLFTEEKLKIVNAIISIYDIIFSIDLILINNVNIFLLAFFAVAISVINYLFKQCVLYNKKLKNK